jgi:hypothetical protein
MGRVWPRHGHHGWPLNSVVKTMKASFADLLKRIPGPATGKWPNGERFVEAFSHGSMTVELYAPSGHDPQTPHEQDELYFVVTGISEFVLENNRMHPCRRRLCFCSCWCRA